MIVFEETTNKDSHMVAYEKFAVFRDVAYLRT